MCFAEIDGAVKEVANLVMQGGALAILAWLVKMLPSLVATVVTGIQNSQAAQAKEREARDERFTKTIDVVQTQNNERNAKLELAIANQTQQLSTKFDQLGVELKAHSESVSKAVLSVCKATGS
jgi:hypothetical protein